MTIELNWLHLLHFVGGMTIGVWIGLIRGMQWERKRKEPTP
jgi:hypothetical protein